MKNLPKRVNVFIFVFTKNPSLKFLLLKRIPEKSGYWQPVCGGIKPNETYLEAVYREFREETGISASNIKQVINLDHSHQYSEQKNNKKYNMEDHCFGIEIMQIQDIQLSYEHEEFKWVNLDELPNLFTWKLGLTAFDKLCDIIN